MQKKAMYFFATKDDLIYIIEQVEKILNVKYILQGVHYDKNIEQYDSLINYEKLGVNICGSHDWERFLVMEKNKKLRIKRLLQLDFKIRYLAEQEQNKDSIYFAPGGMYNDSCLVHGSISTFSRSETSIRIYEIFKKCIKQVCQNRKDRFYFSDNVKLLGDDIRLITITAKQPKEYDFKI